MLTDNELVKKVKELQDSSALNELVDRHSGIYHTILDRQVTVPPMEKQDFIADKTYNIYQYALDYDPTRNMKFSVYLGQRLKWQCYDTINKHVETEQITPTVLIGTDQIKDESVIKFIIDNTIEIKDKRFFEIFRLRHLCEKKTSWKRIGKLIGMTYEGARKIYLHNIEFLRSRLIKENLLPI